RARRRARGERRAPRGARRPRTRRHRRALGRADDARPRGAQALAPGRDLERLTPMLTAFDDYLIHQTPEPVAHPGTADRNFYDRHFFNGFSREGDLFCAAAPTHLATQTMRSPPLLHPSLLREISKG